MHEELPFILKKKFSKKCSKWLLWITFSLSGGKCTRTIYGIFMRPPWGLH